MSDMNPEEMEIPDSSRGENVSVKLEQDEDDHHLTRARKIIYEVGADATLEFDNGERFYINKTALALESKYFFHAFFESSSNTLVKIQDFDREAFQTFLDCLFGLKEYSVSVALMIYPIAHKFEVEKCLRKCVSILKPTEMNGNVCRTLNLALSCECEELVESVSKFIKNRIGIVALIENDNYRCLLEPKTISKLIEAVYFDSYVWKIIYEWGENYLKSRMINKDIRLFFIENDILKKLSLSDFESVQSMFDFHRLTNKRLMDSDEIFDYIQNNFSKSSDKKLPEKSCWRDVTKGEQITETIVFKNSLVVSSKDSKDGITLHIRRNVRRLKKLTDCLKIIQCKPRLYFRSLLSEKVKTKRETPCPKRFRNSTGNASSISTCRLGPNDESYSLDLIHEIDADYFRGISRVLSFPINIPCEFSEIKSVEITYTFRRDCRILKTSISENFVHGDNLYFTKDVNYSKF